MFALVYFVGDLSPGPGRKKSEKTPRGWQASDENKARFEHVI